MNNIGEYIGRQIKSFRMSNKLTQDELGELLGTKKATISNYETGYRTPNQDVLFKLADIFNTTINDFFPPTEKIDIHFINKYLNEKHREEIFILGLKRLLTQKNGKQLLAENEALREAVESYMATGKISNIDKSIDNSQSKIIRVYGQTAAGTPIEYVDGFVDEEEVEEIPTGANRALRIKGNSMSPLLEDGQIVFYKDQDQLENGQIGIFEINGEAVTCKRFKPDYDNQKIILKSENPNYEDMVFSEEEVRILGLVKM